MPAALELIAGQTTAPSTTFTAWTVASGNSLTIRSADPRSEIDLLAAWAFHNGAGNLRIRSPRLHDNVQGIRMRVDATDPRPIYPRYRFKQKLIAQDVLTVENTGSAGAGNFEQGALLVYYTDLPGISARYITTDQLARWGLNQMGQDLPLTPGAGGGYTGQVAINSSVDNGKANTDYALMGYRVDANCSSLRIQGVDVGNLGIGGPGVAAQPDLTSMWFCWLTDYYQIPLIPVFNWANKGAILVDVQQNQGGAAVNATFFFVELMPASLRS